MQISRTISIKTLLRTTIVPGHWRMIFIEYPYRMVSINRTGTSGISAVASRARYASAMQAWVSPGICKPCSSVVPMGKMSRVRFFKCP